MMIRTAQNATAMCALRTPGTSMVHSDRFRYDTSWVFNLIDEAEHAAKHWELSGALVRPPTAVVDPFNHKDFAASGCGCDFQDPNNERGGWKVRVGVDAA
eukprot:6203685-Prymnesium_polylepis.1